MRWDAYRDDVEGAGDRAEQALPTPGKRTLTERLVDARRPPAHGSTPALVPQSAEPSAGAALQADGALVVDDPFALHTAAAAGVAGASDALPHADAIAASFGHHDVAGIRAQIGGPAAAASDALGARAYAYGDAVAFPSAPDLRLAAHEAAHVVQQRGGVRLDGGVGRAGDPYERHADAVADLVVAGQSAESLLDTMAHRGPAGGPAVQRDDRDGDGVDDDRASPVTGHAADLPAALNALTHATVPQLQAVVSAIPQRLANRPEAGAIYQVWIGTTRHYVGGPDLAPLRREANSRARLRQATVEARQDWSPYERALDDAAPVHSADDDPARATAIRAVAANADLGLHGTAIRALWETLLPGEHAHAFFTRALTDRLAARGAPNGVLDADTAAALRLGEAIVPASTRRRGPGALAALDQAQLNDLAAALGAPSGSAVRTEARRGAGRLQIDRAFWVAASSWQAWALRDTGRAPTGTLSSADIDTLLRGAAPTAAAAPADAERDGSVAGDPAATGESTAAGESAAGESAAGESATGGLTAAQRATVSGYRSRLEAARNPPPEPEPAEQTTSGRRTRAERDAASRARRERAAARTAAIEADVTSLLNDTILPGMRRLSLPDWSPAQMLQGADPVNRWATRVIAALSAVLGEVGTTAADASARAELEAGGYVVSAATLRRVGWDPRLATSHFETDEDGRRHRVIDETPEDRSPEVQAELDRYRALVTKLHRDTSGALAGVSARPTDEERTAAITRFQRALAAIEARRRADWAHHVLGLEPPPTLIRHAIHVTWPRTLDSSATDYSGLLAQVREWDRVFGGLLASGRRDHSTLAEADRATTGYGVGIVNTNRDAVYVDLHRTGVEITNNHGNALTPDETRSSIEGNSTGDMSMHLDPVFALKMVRFLENLASRGVTRMWTSGFLRSAMSPADTHPMGMACDITGFSFGDEHVIHLRSGYPNRDDGPLPSAPSGPSAWFDHHHQMNGQPYAHIVMGIAAMMPGYFDRIIGPGANEAHMAHWHVETSPSGRPRDGLSLHAVSSESTHVPEFMRRRADHLDPDWATAEPIPLTAPAPPAADASGSAEPDPGVDDA